MNSVRETNISHTRYFLNDMINKKNLDANKIKIDETILKNILVYFVGYVTLNSVKLLYLIINKINGYIGESNENKIMLVPSDEIKHTLKHMKNCGVKSEILLDP